MAAPKNQNNLNAIRLLAAAGVLVSHSFPLVSGSDSSEPLFIFSHGQTTFGHCAVIIFFAISGYLITASYLKSQSKPRFVLARLLRLLPGLAVVLIVLAFLLGPRISTLSVTDYFGRWAPYHYVLGNLSLVVKFQDHLPSVFVNNPYGRAVNGSLWTLQYEAGCYLAVLLLGLIGALRWPVTVGLIVVFIILEHVRRGGVAAELAIPFAIGALVRLMPIPLRTWPASVCAALTLLSLHIGGFSVIAGTCGAYAILTFGLRKSSWLPDPAQHVGDLSYGVYVWAFPVQQLAVQMLGIHANWWLLILCSLPPTLMIAALSWHLVEKPAMSFKPRRRDTIINAEPA